MQLYSDKSPPNGLLSETREPIDTAVNNRETNSDKSPPIGLLSEADCCPKTEYSDSDKSPLRTRVRLPQEVSHAGGRGVRDPQNSDPPMLEKCAKRICPHNFLW